MKEDKEQKYNLYHNFRQDLCRISSYQYLAISRGEKEKALKVSFAFRGSSKPSSTKSNDGISDMLDRVLIKLPKGFHGGFKHTEFPKTAQKQEAWKKAKARLRKMCERMWRRQLKEMAEENAVVMFSANLHQKMLTPPLRYWARESGKERFEYCEDEARIIALDPGFAHGTKVAVVKTCDGKVLNTCTLNMRSCDEAVGLLRSILWENDNDTSNTSSDVIAVGNGHGSQNAVQIVKEAIGNKAKYIKNIIYVDETGASIYSGRNINIRGLTNVCSTSIYTNHRIEKNNPLIISHFSNRIGKTRAAEYGYKPSVCS